MPCTRITLENFRCIESIVLDLPAGSASRTGWYVLLGENSVGKSSVLQAVALALAGESLDGIDYEELVFRKARPKKGRVRLQFSTEPEEPPSFHEVAMELGPSGPDFGQNATIWDSSGHLLGIGYVFGFGAARWLPKEESLVGPPPWDGWRARIANLFNPFVPLLDGIDWLEQLSEKEFRKTERPLLRLLERPSTDRLRRRKGR